MFLFSNTLSRFVIAFLPRSKCLLISWLQSLSSVILKSQKENLSLFPFFPIYCHEKMTVDATTLVFWMLYFKPAFSLSSFTFIKRLVSSSSRSAVRVVLCAYPRLLIFLLAILIPAFDSSRLAFQVMYSAYKLSKQDDNIQPWCTPFPIFNQLVVPCLILTVASLPASRFLRRWVRWSDIAIYLRNFHSSLWSTQSNALV